MRKRFLAILALAALAAACNPGVTPMPTLSLQRPSVPPVAPSEMPIQTVTPSS